MASDVYVSISADTGPLEAAFAKSRAEVAALTRELNKNAAEARKAGTVADTELVASQNRLGEALSAAKGEMAGLNREIKEHNAAAVGAREEVASLAAQFRQLTEGITGVRERFSSASKLFAEAFAVHEAAAFVAETTEAAEKVERLEAELGASADQVQRIGGIAALTGTDFASLSSQLERMQLRLREAASASNPAQAALKALNIDAKQFAALPIPQQLDELADKLSQFADGSAKTAIMVALLGRAGADMIPYLDRGKEGVRELNEKLERSGAILDGRTISALSRTSEDIHLLGLATKAAGARLLEMVNGPVDAAIRGMTALAAAANPQTSGLSGQIKTFANDSIDEAKAVADFAVKAAAAFDGLGRAIQVANKGLLGLLTNAASLDTSKLDKTGGIGPGVGWLWNRLTSSGDASGVEGLRQKRSLFQALNPSASSGLPDFSAYQKEVDEELKRQKARLDAVKASADAAHASVNRALGNPGYSGPHPRNEKKQAPDFTTGRTAGGKGRKGGTDHEAVQEARESYAEQVDAARQAASDTIDALDHEVRAHKISWSEWAKDSIAALEKEKAAIQAASAEAVKSAEFTAVEKKRIAREASAEISRLNRKEADDAAKAAEETQRSWDSFFKSFNSSIEGQIGALISGQDRQNKAARDHFGRMIHQQNEIGVAFRKVLDSMLVDLVKFFAQWTLKQAEVVIAHVAGNALIKASDETTNLFGLGTLLASAARAIGVDAGVTAAGVAANQAPLTGPLAVAQGAAAASTVLGFAAYDIGAWEIPHDQLALVHRQELVMPAAQATAFREMLSARSTGEVGAASVAIHPTTHFHMSAIDGPSVASWMRSNSSKMAKSLDEAVRHGAALGLKRLSGR